VFKGGNKKSGTVHLIGLGGPQKPLDTRGFTRPPPENALGKGAGFIQKRKLWQFAI